ncbi:MAG TPA: hypothetical protein HPP84_10540 [Rhodospirillaceae bacterium]|nr:hypothetical protein [Rhodospirillaceae bacterium]
MSGEESQLPAFAIGNTFGNIQAIDRMAKIFFNDPCRFAHESIISGADGERLGSAVEADYGPNFRVFLGNPLNFRGALRCGDVDADGVQ